jgi:pimeloyl-ACP methyl ester carboxylesterase
MIDHQITTAGGCTLGFSDFGAATAVPVLWCHGGPESRKEPLPYAEAASNAGFRLIGIDRPGYGASSPYPGRTIGDWAADALAVADQLALEQFYLVGVSTGGSYALATASAAPDRVCGVVACCAMTDMRWAAKQAMMPANERIWNALDRAAAQAIAIEDFGEDGSRMLAGDDVATMLAPADLALLADPSYAAQLAGPEPFAQGVVGYADDRIADGPVNGWSSFDLSAVVCPVSVIHGEADGIVPVAHAHHTAELLPGAALRTFADHGHLSVISEVVPTLMDLTLRA